VNEHVDLFLLNEKKRISTVGFWVTLALPAEMLAGMLKQISFHVFLIFFSSLGLVLY
jgi:hypothetical protein